MTKPNLKRLAELEQTIHSIPIPVAVVRKAFEVFKTTGELPDDIRLAHTVIRRCKRGAAMSDLYDSTADWGTLIRAQMETPKRPDDPVTDALYDEAVFGDGVVREAARHLLRGFAKVGLDPTEPQFAGQEWDLPVFGSVGMDLLGIPERLAKEPYLEQAERLFTRVDLLRAIIPHDPKWIGGLENAVEEFRRGGAWPEDNLLLEAVLVVGEVDAVVRHAVGGEDVAEIMSAFDVAATAVGEERQAAIGKVQQLARTG